MRKLISIAIVITMILAIAIPAMAAPIAVNGKTNFDVATGVNIDLLPSDNKLTVTIGSVAAKGTLKIYYNGTNPTNDVVRTIDTTNPDMLGEVYTISENSASFFYEWIPFTSDEPTVVETVYEYIGIDTTGSELALYKAGTGNDNAVFGKIIVTAVYKTTEILSDGTERAGENYDEIAFIDEDVFIAGWNPGASFDNKGPVSKPYSYSFKDVNGETQSGTILIGATLDSRNTDKNGAITRAGDKKPWERLINGSAFIR